MRTLILIAGILCLLIVLFDAFQTIILPRRAIGRFRLTRIFYILTWPSWRFVARRMPNPQKRETLLSYYGPLSLILLLVVWAAGMVFGFALIFYAMGSPFSDSLGQKGFIDDLYMSGTTIFTFGLGDVLPRAAPVRGVVIVESGFGLGLLAIVMGYFPVLYSAFSRREVSISLLDARAGSPPTAAELLRRHSVQGADQSLTVLLTEWERWSAELLESHISYPLLCYFRSQHNNQSWISALTAILDTCALLIAGVRGHEARQAQLTFAMARHAVIDLSQIFSLKPVTGAKDRLPPERYSDLINHLCQAGVGVCRDEQSFARLCEIRELYEGYAAVLGDFLVMQLPPWMPEKERKDNWMKVAKLRAETEATAGGAAAAPVPAPDDAARAVIALADLHHHDF